MRGTALLIFAPALFAAAPAPRVLTSQGFGGVRVGMTRVQAERAIASPLRIDYPDTDNRSCGMAARRDGRDKSISYMIEGGRVTRIDINGPTIRTARGVGVGSTIAQLRKAYGQRLKSHPNQYTDQPDFHVKGPRGFGLIFETDDGRVVTMRGGRYPSVAYIESCL